MVAEKISVNYNIIIALLCIQQISILFFWAQILVHYTVLIGIKKIGKYCTLKVIID